MKLREALIGWISIMVVGFLFLAGTAMIMRVFTENFGYADGPGFFLAIASMSVIAYVGSILIEAICDRLYDVAEPRE